MLKCGFGSRLGLEFSGFSTWHFLKLVVNGCFLSGCSGFLSPFDRLVGLVVKASASRAEGPGFESRLRRDFFGVESYQ